MPLPQKRLIPGILFALMIAAIAAPPLWWSTGNPPVIDPSAAVNNHGPANIGQAKHMAKSALDALRIVRPAVADQIEVDLVGNGKPIPSWDAPGNQDEKDKNHAPLLIGQLKAIADPFYTHIHNEAPTWLEAERIANGTQHPDSIFPWTAETTDDANKAIANIGQLKAVFSLRFDTLPPNDPNDSDGDGLPNLWEFVHGLSNTVNSASGLFQGGPATNLQAYQQGVQAVPGATIQNKDGDEFDNDLDAVPDDGEINWHKTPEKRYVWVEQVTRGGAKAVSKHGHILFPKSNVGSPSAPNPLNVLWDSNTSSWVPLTGASTWENSGFLAIYGSTSAVFNAEWLEIDDMNDQGIVVGRSKEIGYIPAPPINTPPIVASAVMKWQMSGIATYPYGPPIYVVPGFNHLLPSGDLEKLLEYEAPRIADDGTISAVANRLLGNYNTVTEWVASDAQAIGHSKDMAVWGDFEWDFMNLKFHSGAVIGATGGLLVENQIIPPYLPKYILHYRNGAAAESLEGLLPSTDYAITDTDICRTPATAGSTEGRIWFSVNHAEGDDVFLEKRFGGSGVSRWHNPPSMGEGALRLNVLGEAITHGNTSVPPKLWRNGNYTDLNNVNLTSKPTSVKITKAIDIASNGIILAEAVENGVTKTGLLMPIELRDIKKVADQNDDVVIENIPPKEANETENAYIQRSLSNKQIAYIEPHGATNDTDPEMPHLVAKLPGGPPGLKVRWKLLVEYKRSNGYRASYVNDFTRPEDTVMIPASGEYTAEMDADEEWRIFETEDWTNEISERGFFGGTAKLYMWFPRQGAEPTESFMTFRIGGKNPDQAKAKTFINSTAGTQFSYAYAIAKHETYGRIRENGQIRFYNQFYTDYKQGPIGDASVDMGLAAWAKAWPLYNLDRGRNKNGSRYQNGPGGYGIYQLTLGPKLPNATIPAGGEQFIQRMEIWNWQDNVRGAINELQGKLSAAQSLLNGLQSTYSQWPAVPNEGHFSGLDAIVVTYYNGTGGLPSRKVNGASKKTPWTPEIRNSNTRYWKFHQNQQDYVQSVNGQIE